jgi:hypothetical protein
LSWVGRRPVTTTGSVLLRVDAPSPVTFPNPPYQPHPCQGKRPYRDTPFIR